MKLYGDKILPKVTGCDGVCGSTRMPFPIERILSPTLVPQLGSDFNYVVQVADVRDITKASRTVLNVEEGIKKHPCRTMVITFTVCHSSLPFFLTSHHHVRHRTATQRAVALS